MEYQKIVFDPNNYNGLSVANLLKVIEGSINAINTVNEQLHAYQNKITSLQDENFLLKDSVKKDPTEDLNRIQYLQTVIENMEIDRSMIENIFMEFSVFSPDAPLETMLIRLLNKLGHNYTVTSEINEEDSQENQRIDN